MLAISRVVANRFSSELGRRLLCRRRSSDDGSLSAGLNVHAMFSCFNRCSRGELGCTQSSDVGSKYFEAGSLNPHAVSVREEPVTFLHRAFVGVKNVLAAGER